MKLLFSIIVLFVATLGVTSESSEEFEKLMTEEAAICQKEIGASDKDVQEMLEGVIPKTRVAKCLNACLMIKLGVMKDGKLVPDQLVKLYEDDESKGQDGNFLKDVIKDIANACKTVSDKDKCDAAEKILTCLNSEGQKRGFDNVI